ncbi:MAG: glycosyltransferase family 4 protein [Candidatus Omnitrophota bacterium]
MRILLVNKFLCPKGGDAVSAVDTGRLLRARGHKVVFWGMAHPQNPSYPQEEYFVPYVDLNGKIPLLGRLNTAVNVLYSFPARANLGRLLKVRRPDIAHLHNIYHQISPSILHSLKKRRIPVVMTLHDYKLACASYSLLDKGRPCQACCGGRYYRCFLRGCVKGSRLKSLLNTIEMYLHHRLLRIYELVDVFIAPSRFLKAKLQEMGFKGRIVYLPNFLNLEEFGPRFEAEDNSIVYFGRLSQEKGLETLLSALRGLRLDLKIIGEGPLKERLQARARQEGLSNVAFLGHKSGEALREEIGKARFVVLPSECYENNPRSLIEAFALGKPAVAARIGGIPELVRDNETGLTFAAGDIKDLRLKIGHLTANPDKIREMGKNARAFVEQELNAQRHYAQLLKIYDLARSRLI